MAANYQLLQPVFPLAVHEGDDKGRLDPFPWDEEDDIALPEGYKPTKYDIINGRGRKSYNHIANKRFRLLIASNLPRYKEASCRVDKTLVVIGIVSAIRKATPCGAFIKFNVKKDRWVSLSDETAREKVGHCLRDMRAAKSVVLSRSQKAGALPLPVPELAAAARLPLDEGPATHVLVPGIDYPSGRHSYFGSDKLLHPQAEDPSSSTEQPMITPSSTMGYNPTLWAAHQQMNIMSRTAMAAAVGNHPLMAISPYTGVSYAANNFVAGSQQDENMGNMSEQQRNILNALESGFKGTVEELIATVGV